MSKNIKWKYDCENCDLGSDIAITSKCIIQQLKCIISNYGFLHFALTDDFLSDFEIIINKECSKV